MSDKKSSLQLSSNLCTPTLGRLLAGSRGGVCRVRGVPADEIFFLGGNSTSGRSRSKEEESRPARDLWARSFGPLGLAVLDARIQSRSGERCAGEFSPVGREASLGPRCSPQQAAMSLCGAR